MTKIIEEPKYQESVELMDDKDMATMKHHAETARAKKAGNEKLKVLVTDKIR